MRLSLLLVRYNLICGGQDRWWDRNADGFRCRDIDYKFEFSRLRERKIGRVGTMKYLMHVIRAAPI